MGIKKCSIARIICYLMVLAFVSGIAIDIDHILAPLLGIDNKRFLHPVLLPFGVGFLVVGSWLIITPLCRYLGTRILRQLK